MAYITLSDREFLSLADAVKTSCTSLALGSDGHLFLDGAIVSPAHPAHLPPSLLAKLVEMGKA